MARKTEKFILDEKRLDEILLEAGDFYNKSKYNEALKRYELAYRRSDELKQRKLAAPLSHCLIETKELEKISEALELLDQYIPKEVEAERLDEILMNFMYLHAKGNQYLGDVYRIAGDSDMCLEKHEKAFSYLEFLSDNKEKIQSAKYGKLKRDIIRHYAIALMEIGSQYEEAKEELNELIKEYDKLQELNVFSDLFSNGIKDEISNTHFIRAKANYWLGLNERKNKYFEEALADLDKALDPIEYEYIEAKTGVKIVKYDSEKEESTKLDVEHVLEKIQEAEKISDGPHQHKYLMAKANVYDAMGDYENGDLYAELAVLFLDRKNGDPENELKKIEIRALNKQRKQVKEEQKTEISSVEQFFTNPAELVSLIGNLVENKDGKGALRYVKELEKIEIPSEYEKQFNYYKGMAQTIVGIEKVMSKMTLLEKDLKTENLESAVKAFKELRKKDYKEHPKAQAYLGLAYLTNSVENYRVDKTFNKTALKNAKKEFKTARDKLKKIKADDRTSEEFEALILSTYCLECFKNFEQFKNAKDIPKNEVGSKNFRNAAIKKEKLTKEEINSILSLVLPIFREDRDDFKKERFDVIV